MIRSRLKSLRNRKDLTQEEIAKKLDMARTTYSGYENGSRDPDPETLKKIADFHEVSIDYILGRNTPNKDAIIDESIEIYQTLSPESRELVNNVIRTLADKEK